MTALAFTTFDGQSAGTLPSRADQDEPHEQFGVSIGSTSPSILTPDLPDSIDEGATSDNYSGVIGGQLDTWAGTTITGGPITLRHASLYGITADSSNSLIAYSLTITTQRCTNSTNAPETTAPTTSTPDTSTTQPSTTAPATTAPDSSTAGGEDCRTESVAWSGFASLHAWQGSFDTGMMIAAPVSGETLRVTAVEYTAFDGQSPGATPTRADQNEPHEQFGISIGTSNPSILTPDLPDSIDEGATSDNYSGVIGGQLDTWTGTPISGGEITLRHASLYGITTDSSNSLIAYSLTITTQRCTNSTNGPSTTVPDSTSTTSIDTTTTAAATTTTTAAASTTSTTIHPAECGVQSYSWSGFASLHAHQSSFATGVVIPAPVAGEKVAVLSVSYTAFDGQSPGATPTRADQNEPHEQFGISIGTTNPTILTADLPDTTDEGATSDNYSGVTNGQLDTWTGTPISGGEITLRHASLYGVATDSSNSLIAYNLTVSVERCQAGAPGTSGPTTTTTVTTAVPTTAPQSTTTVGSTTDIELSAQCQLSSYTWNGFASLHAYQPSFATGVHIPAPPAGERLAVLSVSYTAFDGQSPGATPTRADQNEPHEQFGISIGTTNPTILTPDLPDSIDEGATSDNYSGVTNGQLDTWTGTPISGGEITLRHASLYGITTDSSNSLIAYSLTVDTRQCPLRSTNTDGDGTGTTTTTTTTTTTGVTTTTTTTTPAGGVLDAGSIALQVVGTVGGGADIATRPGDPALYVVGLGGVITALDPTTHASTVVLALPAGTTGTAQEQGLLGLAFSPDGSLAYIDYVNAAGDTNIVEYAVGSDGVFDPASRRVVMEIDQPHGSHYGGAVRTGPDGYLYIGMGDGGGIGGDPERRALNLSDLLGKILRIDPSVAADGAPYSIPNDNPFVDTPGARPEIWAIGVRNPWRFTFDQLTGDLWIGDVGQDRIEEIDVAWAADGSGRGANFGWSAYEGSQPFNTDQPTAGVTMPIREYTHVGTNCSITGGFRYRGTAIPALYGWYVYADWCSGQLRALQVNADGSAGEEIVFSTSSKGITSFGQDASGELYATNLFNQKVLAIVANSAP